MGWWADRRERREGRKVLASEAHGPISPDQARHFNTVNLDRDVIPLDDPDDPTSFIMQLAMRGHMVSMSQSGPDDSWVVTIDDDPREWVHQHQIVALAKALKDVLNDENKEGTA